VVGRGVTVGGREIWGRGGGGGGGGRGAFQFGVVGSLFMRPDGVLMWPFNIYKKRKKKQS